MKGSWKKSAAGAGMALLFGLSVLAQPSFADPVSAETTHAFFAVNGEWAYLDDGYAVISYQDHLYVPARFVAENMGAAVSWDEATQTVSFQSGKGSKAEQGAGSFYKSGPIAAQTQEVHFVFNGQEKTLDSGYAALSYQDHVYVPARFVAENLGALVQWGEHEALVNVAYLEGADGLSWLKSFAENHPGELISGLKAGVKFSAGTDAYTVVVTHKDGNLAGNVYFVNADGKETKLWSNIESVAQIRSIAQGDHNVVFVNGGAGMHGSWLYAFLYGGEDGPVVVKSFFGDLRTDVFMLDGKIEVAESNTDTGNSDEYLYEWNPANREFVTLDTSVKEYTKASFTNPILGAYDTIWEMRGYVQGDEGGGIPNEWNPHAAETMNAALPQLQWLKEYVTRTDAHVLTTADGSTDQKKTYRYTQGEHAVDVTLVYAEGRGWVVDAIQPVK
ncbi:copper amine oxidase N-terminal domain-containing protein [Tumebacillus flagellatus]|uniref:Copper amine oxidase-like N-terminal domain-containing protein n=1 Tax=Tumebacillus flagellatus TaxID=1157490 RepID=A0A074LL19_9BACL|nr:copper amine oxidase N-terminal domain-containing protein [Tumebacillus flagellatus]KEO82831.1 hypothetical protein EL26_13050 [Tumebacillus flagellatus]